MNKIRVRVKLFSALDGYVQNYNPSTGIEVLLDDGATVIDLIESLDLTPKIARIVLVGNMIRKVDHQLVNGDVVHLFGLIGGG
ncbi:MAG: MoaD/ThiS family protein [Deltaproteobacteria bacterium]|nr:MoaD/ThiS family protein [Deltaproteobacteria bacterium]